MKRYLTVLLLMFCIPAQADVASIQTNTSVQPSQLTIPQNINYQNCTKIFNIDKEKLFCLTLASISANKFNIEEIQSELGYIMFSANRRQYLASVGKIDGTNSILKITPCNNVYNFPPGILTNIYKYIEINMKG